jgi:hypothetical protein
MKVIYEPHPINPARKAKLQSQGYKIIDAIFAPPGTPLHQKLEVEGEEEIAPAPEPIVADQVQEVVEETEEAAEPEDEGDVEAEEVSGDEEPRKRGRPRKE